MLLHLAVLLSHFYEIVSQSTMLTPSCALRTAMTSCHAPAHPARATFVSRAHTNTWLLLFVVLSWELPPLSSSHCMLSLWKTQECNRLLKYCEPVMRYLIIIEDCVKICVNRLMNEVQGLRHIHSPNRYVHYFSCCYGNMLCRSNLREKEFWFWLT